MSKKESKIEAPKNNDINYLRIGDFINLKVDIGIYNTTYKRIKYSQKEINKFIYNMVSYYFDILGKSQNPKK